MSERGVWRRPDEESVGLYPGLVVHDGRVTGSITVGRSRLPLWCFMPAAIYEDWKAIEDNWEPSRDGWKSAEPAAEFIGNLLQMRGEFARLLLVLANAQRRDCDRQDRCKPRSAEDHPWWENRYDRGRVLAQLRRCLDVLEREP